MNYRVVVSLLWLLASTSECDEVSRDSKQLVEHLSTMEIVGEHGYPLEVHTVTTEDGYILELHRIPHGKHSSTSDKSSSGDRPIAFMQHGIMASSSDWVLMGPEKGLGFLMADKGWDVWMSNCRGNDYSKKHVTLSTSSHEFWDFTWDEMAKYDVPAEFDYIESITGKRNMTYIAHSMGTSIFFALMASKPEYNERIDMMIAFAPIVYLQHNRSPLKLIANIVGPLGITELIIGQDSLTPESPLFKFYGEVVCNFLYVIGPLICSTPIFIVVGFDKTELNDTIVSKIVLTHDAAQTSSKTIEHYVQEINSGVFQMFDRGAEKNMKKYNSAIPPVYDLNKVTAPVAIFFGPNDLLYGKQDLDKLFVQLPNLVTTYKVPYKFFNHIDYLFANDVIPLLYNAVFNVIEGKRTYHSESRSMPDVEENNLPVSEFKRFLNSLNLKDSAS